ncbi:hypothetical protein PCANC_28565 [Puccinia coronata f. sp. avenae]|uniref:Uncharacterized protein n=1 Tax=Puccinia coronata f. sp. avenae TaxID=200324 RepID=A0A2N5THQ4_9BASI|nr:hypothetical protein PCANC_28565 [Puccinia coronata f. sp. avenae]
MAPVPHVTLASNLTLIMVPTPSMLSVGGSIRPAACRPLTVRKVKCGILVLLLTVIDPKRCASSPIALNLTITTDLTVFATTQLSPRPST